MGVISKDGIEKKYTVEEIEQAIREMRGYILTSICCAGSGHSGGSLSAIDAVGLAYLETMKHKPSDPDWDDRDRMFFSVGHKAPAWYVALGYTGYFDVKDTALLRKLGTPFQGHPDKKKCKGIELSCGSLGQGLSVAVGDALRARLDGKSYTVYCLMGDGEQQEGQIWEAAMAAGHYKLGNLVAILDRNRLQIDGWTKDVLTVDPLEDKYVSFGWHVITCDGHSIPALQKAYAEAAAVTDKPVVIIADTVKGKGVSFMEDKAGWHGKAPSRDELKQALKELNVEYLPAAEMLQAADDYQRNMDEKLDSEQPTFSRDYWWNSGDTMQVVMEPTRKGFGKALDETTNPDVVALGADISGSICINNFFVNHPDRMDRWFSMGIAEQSGTDVAAGLAKEGKIPFFGTYGVFAAGRALDQLRTTVCYGELNVKIAGAHAGISVGPDGATHQALEELFQIAGLPNMRLLCPADSVETRKCTDASIDIKGPCYLRFAREATPVISTEETPYEFGKATVIDYKGTESASFIDAFETRLSTDAPRRECDLVIVACGPIVSEAMRAAWMMKAEYNLDVRVINMSTIKPLDRQAIENGALDSSAVLSVEEHQKGGLGHLVSSTLLQSKALYGKPMLFDMIGVDDTFGTSGSAWELMKYFGLTAEHIVVKAKEMIDRKQAAQA